MRHVYCRFVTSQCNGSVGGSALWVEAVITSAGVQASRPANWARDRPGVAVVRMEALRHSDSRAWPGLGAFLGGS